MMPLISSISTNGSLMEAIICYYCYVAHLEIYFKIYFQLICMLKYFILKFSIYQRVWLIFKYLLKTSRSPRHDGHKEKKLWSLLYPFWLGSVRSDTLTKIIMTINNFLKIKSRLAPSFANVMTYGSQADHQAMSKLESTSYE